VPPDRRGGGPDSNPGTARHHRRQSLIKDQHPQDKAPRHLGRYASGWRDGFAAGAADALRVAGRRLPVETWHIVEALADAYELAAGDE
jgi:hypothetical protein